MRDSSPGNQQPKRNDLVFQRSSLGIPVDLNTLQLSQHHLHKSKPETGHVTSLQNVKSKHSTSFRSYRGKKFGENNLNMRNTYTSKLGNSKSCEIPTLLSSKTRGEKQKARRTISAPETVKLEINNAPNRFAFERTYIQAYPGFKNNGNESMEGDESSVKSLKLPAIRITATDVVETRNSSEARMDHSDIGLSLPSLEKQNIYRYQRR